MFHNKLRNCNPFEKEYLEYQELICSGLTTESALVKRRLFELPPTGGENCSYLDEVWEQETMQSFKDFFRWYNNKEVVPTLEAMQQIVDFHHKKGIDMLKLGCILANLAKFRLHNSTCSKSNPFTKTDKNCFQISGRCGWKTVNGVYS